MPRILQKDENTLRCFFLSMDVQNRETESWYRDYYISEGCFSDCIYPLWMETAQRKIRLSPTPFYEEAKTAYAIVATGEMAVYANVMLQKGVVTE